MKKLLCSYGFGGSFYLLFAENGVISMKKLGTNYNNNDMDWEIAKKVVSRIADLKYIFNHTFQYKNETFNTYYNLFNERIYISRYERSKEVPCSYEEYKKLYDRFQTKVVCYRNNRNGPPRAWNQKRGISPHYGNSAGGFGTYTPYRPKQGLRGAKVVIGGAIIALLIICSTALLTNCRGATFKSPIEEAICSQPDEYIGEIQQQLTEEGIEEWAINSVIDQFRDNYGLPTEGMESNRKKGLDASEEIPPTKASQMLMQSIKDNDKLSDEDKLFFEKNFTGFFKWNSEYMDNASDVAERLNTLQIEYKSKEELMADYKKLNEESEDKDNYSIAGFYVPGENRIEIAEEENEISLNDTRGHEATHAVGSFGHDSMYSALAEGFTQLYNPTREKCAMPYTINETFAIIVEQIYGPDFMRECFFGSKSLYTQLIERFSPNQPQYINLMEIVSTGIEEIQKEEYSIYWIKDNPEALSKAEELLKELKDAYKDLTGENWENNKVLRLCEARLKGETPNGFKITDISLGKDGNGYVCQQEGNEITVKLPVTLERKN